MASRAEYPTSQEVSYWHIPIEDLFAQVQTFQQGLSSAEAGQRLARYGPNTLKAKKRQGVFRLLLGQFASPIMLILLFATAVSAGLGDWLDALIILAIVLGSGLLSFTQEYRASSAIEKLQSQVRIKATTLRDGKEQAIPAEEIVPGDIVILSAGSLIPADGVLLEAKDFFVNQAVLTGETYPAEKKPGAVEIHASLSERTNCVFMGTSVRNGSGRALIVQTGKATAFGQIAGQLMLRPPETEFERGIRHFGYLLTEVMLVLVLAVFAINVYFQKPVVDSLLFSVALAVGLTPQLLPAIINIILSRGSQTMAEHGVIVRRLVSIENFGSMDILCTDKTGTLTEGIVKLDGALDIRGQPRDEVFRYAFLNAHFQSGMANPLDDAIVAYDDPEHDDVQKIDEVPYDFIRKRLSVVVQDGGQTLMITKGALESVLGVCSQVWEGDHTDPRDGRHQELVEQRYVEWSEQGYRVLGIAIKPVEPKETFERDDERDLTFMGYLLFFDPPKPDVQATIADLASLGVQIKIITGDNHLVARHIAQAVGLEATGVLSGSQIDELRDEALWQAAERTNLFTEVDPNQKERIIQAVQKHGHVVGYMGDGINDAPALHAADVGISVETAADVAKDAADFVLLKHDLGALHEGIVMGRRTFANTLKYVFAATSANFGNMFSMAGASLFLPFLPLLPAQIMLTNFLTDFPEMTIASDNVDMELIRQPRRWDIAFIRNFMMVFGLLSSVFDFLTFGALLLILHAGPTEFRTGWFVESVISASMIVLVVRTRKPFFKSAPARQLVVATAIIIAVVLVLPFTPLAGVLKFTALPASFMIMMGAIVVAYITFAEITKRLFYRMVNS